MGPTASGKTDLALKICDAFPCDIISVDSVMIYRGLDIGSAKPSQYVLAEYPHHLIDILNPQESYSVAIFRADAMRLIREISARGKIPLLVGGTMLYFRALQRGLSQMPSANPKIRKIISTEAIVNGWENMHKKLAKIDSVAANRIHPNDPQRIQRALEVYELTGVPISEWQSKSMHIRLPFKALKLALMPDDRALLHQKIEGRFEQMLKDGFMTEMQRLYNIEGLHSGLPSMRAVGYRQAWKHLEGEFSFEEMRDKAIIATRQLAKRQITWLRSEADIIRLAAEGYDFQDICYKIHSHFA